MGLPISGGRDRERGTPKGEAYVAQAMEEYER
jgi:hypothetical protein